MSDPVPHAYPVATLRRRLASLLYEVLSLGTVALVAALAYFGVAALLGLSLDATGGGGRVLFRLYLFLTCGLYLVWCWRRGGQTLAMKTWQIRLVDRDGAPVGLGRAWLRYGLAALGGLAAGLGFAWAFWDREGQFLHDRLLDTRLVYLGRPANEKDAAA